MKLSPSEKYLQILFETYFNIILQKIDEQGGRTGNTSDFEFLQDSRRVFVCELKDLRDTKPSEENGAKITYYPDGSVESSRKNNAISKISKVIGRAYKQLGKYDEPKILVFLNRASRFTVEDLDETFRGFNVLAEDNDNKVRYINEFARSASEGKIKEAKNKIDLYIWADAIPASVTNRNEKFYFRTVTETGRIVFERFFKKFIKD